MIALIQASSAQQYPELPEEKVYSRLGIRKRRANRNDFSKRGFRLSGYGKRCGAYNGNILGGLWLRVVEDFHSEDVSLPKERKTPGLATNRHINFEEALDFVAPYATGHTGIVN